MKSLSPLSPSDHRDALKSGSRSGRPVRVLMLSHTCQSRSEGQAKAAAIARFADIDLRVLTPDRWRHYGTWRAAAPAPAGLALQVEKIAWPWTGPGQFYLHWYPRLAQTLAEFRPDVIDLWEEPWGLVSAQACWLRNRLLPSARIITETEQNIDKRLPPPFGFFRRYTLAAADYGIARSAEAAEVLRRRGYRGVVSVVPNGVDPNAFKPLSAPQVIAARQTLGMEGFVVAYVGRLVAAKGVADLLNALLHCASDVNLLIVGDGPERPGLDARVRALALSQRVRFVGAVSPDDLPTWLGAVDALVLPSRTTAGWKEQFGRVIIEAQACRTPVIGSRSGAIPEVVGDAGLLFPEGDSAALSRCIQTLRDEPDRRAALAEAGYRRVAAQFTWTRVAERMRDIYLELAGDVQAG